VRVRKLPQATRRPVSPVRRTRARTAFTTSRICLGTFKIRVTHAGFKASEKVGIMVRASDFLVFNLALAVGAVSEQITVEASAIQVGAVTSEPFSAVNREEFREFPRSWPGVFTATP